MQAKIRNGQIIFSMPLQKPKVSASGKSLVVATSRGKEQTAAIVDGKPVFIIANAMIELDPAETNDVALPPNETKRGNQ